MLHSKSKAAELFDPILTSGTTRNKQLTARKVLLDSRKQNTMAWSSAEADVLGTLPTACSSPLEDFFNSRHHDYMIFPELERGKSIYCTLEANRSQLN